MVLILFVLDMVFAEIFYNDWGQKEEYVDAVLDFMLETLFFLLIKNMLASPQTNNV